MATRRETVILELVDSFSTEMARAAAATALVNRELNSLSGRAVLSSRASASIQRDMDGVSKSADRADKSINQLTGRLSLLADAAAFLGPSLVPVGGVAIAGIAGLANQLGFAALAGGVLVGSMQGLGDALKALNDARLEPTEKNLAKAREEMDKLAPSAAKFARELHRLRPVLQNISKAGANSMLPGFGEALEDLQRLAPTAVQIFTTVGEALGDIAADGAASLASERWEGFFQFLAAEAPKTLHEMATTLGDVTHGLAELWMAFRPLNSDFSTWLGDVADGFDEWATGLSGTDGFAEFVDYIRTTGPQVADTLAALGSALVQITQAAAPLGGPTLRILEAFASSVAQIADSDIGTPILAAASAMAVLRRATALYGAAAKTSFGKSTIGGIRSMGAALDTTVINNQRATMSVKEFAAAEKQRQATLRGGLLKGAALAGGLAFATSGMAEKFELANTASMALMGTLAGPWGAAVGAGVGLAMDFAQSNDDLADSLRNAGDALDTAFSQNAGTADLDLVAARYRSAYDALEETKRKIETEGVAGAKAIWEGIFGDNDYEEAFPEVQRLYDQLQVLREREMAARQRAAADKSYYNMLVAETAALKQNVAAMQEKRDAALKGVSAETSYAASLLDTRKSLEENGRAWNLTTEAGIANRRAVEQQAGAWNNLNRSTEQTPAAYRKARAALIDSMVAMGASREEARRYARQLLDIPTSLQTKINMEVDTALQRARAIKSELASIDRNIDVYVNIRRPNAGGYGPQAVTTSADGSTVPKTGLPYADRHHYLLADGEEIISNRRGQADKNRAALKAANAGARIAVVGYADGGTTGYRSGSVQPVMDPRPVKSLEQRLKELTKAIEKDTKQRDQLRQQRDSVRDAARASFNGDLFGNGLAGLQLQLEADRNDAQAMTKALKGAKKKGLDGALLDALAGSGDLNTAQQVEDLSRREIRRLEKLFGQAEGARRNLGATAAAPYNKELRELNHELRQQRAQQRRLEAAIKDMGKNVKDGARAGSPGGIGDREARRNQNTKAGSR